MPKHNVVCSNELIKELLKVWGIEMPLIVDVTIHMPLDDVVSVDITRLADVMDNEGEREKILKKFYLCEAPEPKDEEDNKP